MYRFVYLENYFRHTFLSSCCLITEVIIVADSEEVNRFSEQFVCEFFNYPPWAGTPRPASGSQAVADLKFFKIKTPPSLTGFFMWEERVSLRADS